MIMHGDWEEIQSGAMFRLAVPGGWLILNLEDILRIKGTDEEWGKFTGSEWHPALTFVSDPDHSRKISDDKLEAK